MNLIKVLLDSHFGRFSDNEKNLFKKIEKILGYDVACCLVSLKHFERTSIKEIEVISELIEQFQPLSVRSFIDAPPEKRKVLISGQMGKHHKIEIIPQLKVSNPLSGGRKWSIDLTITLYHRIGQESVKIAAVGIEYDGHDSHYTETGIKKAYLKDAHVATKGIQIIRISPEAWKNNSDYFKKTIKEIFAFNIKQTERVQLETLKSNKNSLKSESDKCPICLGGGILASEFCPACSGLGMIIKGKVIDLDAFDYFDCPECKLLKNTNRSCRTCIGTGYISREKALEIAKDQA